MMKHSAARNIKFICKNWELYAFLLPVVVFYVVFHYIPMYGVTLAFKDFVFADGILGSPWVGLKHFELLFSGRTFFEVFTNTLIISSLKLVFGFPVPIILALLLSEIKNRMFLKTIQTISYLPHFLSWIILSGLLIQILSPSTGVVNYILQLLGAKPIYFLASKEWFRPVLVVSSIWKDIGWGSIIYMATIAGISPELYEASKIDGANRFQMAVHITVPFLVPVITILFIFNAGSIINDDFDQIFNLQNPAVLSVGDVLGTYIYRRGLLDMKMSFATAAGLFINIISLVLVLTTNFIVKKFSEYALW